MGEKKPPNIVSLPEIRVLPGRPEGGGGSAGAPGRKVRTQSLFQLSVPGGAGTPSPCLRRAHVLPCGGASPLHAPRQETGPGLRESRSPEGGAWRGPGTPPRPADHGCGEGCAPPGRGRSSSSLPAYEKDTERGGDPPLAPVGHFSCRRKGSLLPDSPWNRPAPQRPPLPMSDRTAACAAASRAMGTRKGEQLT